MAEKVAIFLDVENLSGWLKADGGETLLDRANELGRVIVRRAYGDFSQQAVSIRQTELNLLGFEFVHVYHPVRGKNSADIQIVVDVMEYLARIPDLEWVVLATGDSDFSPLFRRLRELGKSVVGVGPRSALSEAVKKSCNRFIYTDEVEISDSKAFSVQKEQMYEDALDLLSRVLNKFPEGITLAILKHEMLEMDSAFDEKNLDFSGFLRFVQSAPAIAQLYQVKQIWHARTFHPDSKKNNASATKTNSLEIQLTQPSIDIYKQFLRKKGWRSYDASFLWDALIKLQAHFPSGFTRSEELQYLIEEFGSKRTRGEIRSAIYVFYKTGFVEYLSKEPIGEPVMIAKPPISERAMSKVIDIVTTQKMIDICKSNDLHFNAELTKQLLINSYTQEQFDRVLTSTEAI